MDESVVKEFEQQQVGTLKLSQAMRIGARMRPQTRAGCLFVDGASCALGAAYEGLTGKTCGTSEYHKVRQAFPAVNGKDGLNNLGFQIARKNDRGWTREAIADWLESKGL